MTHVTPRPVRILLVDDSDVTLHLISLMIRTEGYEVFTCTEPEKALGLVGELEIDIVVSDWSMPVVDGLELFKLISRLHPDVVRIMLTAYPTLELALNAVNSGHVNRFLTKPMRAVEIRSALREAAWEVSVRRHQDSEEEVVFEEEVPHAPPAPRSLLKTSDLSLAMMPRAHA